VNDVIAILVVEDDPLVQAMVEDALSDGGFKAAITASGLDGWEVARSAREMDPAMPVIYMTGTQGEEWASKGVPNSVLLAKPFAPAQLVTAVAGLLNASPPPTEQ
jgi:DNA-binding response OmpR family regulator